MAEEKGPDGALRKNEAIHALQSELLLFAKENLKAYLTYLGDLNLEFAKATLTKTQKSKNWLDQIRPLMVLGDCERLYYDMSYLQQRRPREDNALKYGYVQIPAGLKRIVEFCVKIAKKDPALEEDFVSATQVLNQLCALVNCRLTMIQLYQDLTNRTAPPDYDSLHADTEQILSKYSPQLTHPWLAKLKHNMTNEVKILKSLWKTQGHLARYQFKDTMLWLTICREKLCEFMKKIGGLPKSQHVPSLKLLKRRIVPDEKRVTPMFCTWCEIFISSLLCKASFYFYSLLSIRAQQIGSDFHAKMDMGLEVNHYAYVSKLLQRTQAHSFNLILDCTDKSSPASGYVFCDQNKPPAILQGIDAWPSVLTIPQGLPALKHWPNIISLIIEKKDRLSTGETCIFTEEYPYTQAEARNKGVLGAMPLTPVAKATDSALPATTVPSSSFTKPSGTGGARDKNPSSSFSARPSLSGKSSLQDHDSMSIDSESQVAVVTYVISRVESRTYIVIIHCPWLPNSNFDISTELRMMHGDKSEEDGKTHSRSQSAGRPSERGMLSESFDGYFNKKNEEESGRASESKASTFSGPPTSPEAEDEEDKTIRRSLFRPVAVTRPSVSVVASSLSSRKMDEEHEPHDEERRRFRPGRSSGVKIESSRAKIMSDDEDGGKFGEQLSTRPIQELQEQLALLVSRLRLTAVFDQLRPKSKK